MRIFSSHVCIAGSIMFLLSCNTTPNEKAATGTNSSAGFDLSAARAWIEQDNAKFTGEIIKGDSLALASHYASDGWVMMSNSEPITGSGIASAWGGVIRMGVKDLKVTTVDLIGDSALLAETGTYEMYGAGNKLLDKGKYVVVWKQENGSWKIYRDIGNSSLPARQ